MSARRLGNLVLVATALVAIGLLAPRPARACRYCAPIGELVGLGVLGLLIPAVTEGTFTLIERDTVRTGPDGGWAPARYAVGSLFVAGGLSLALLGDVGTASIGVGSVIGGALMLVRGAAISVELANRGPPEQPTIRVAVTPAGLQLNGRF